MKNKEYAFICTDDYINFDGNLCFKKNSIYLFTSENDVYLTKKNHGGYSHELDLEDIKNHFKPIQNKIETPKTDSIVESVVNQFKERSKRGIEKYGTTLQENNTDDFLQHLKEELMDGILYIQKLQSQKNDN